MTDIWKVKQEHWVYCSSKHWMCRCHPALFRIKKKGQQSFSLRLQFNQPSSQFIYFLSLATVLVCAPPWVSSGLCCHWPQWVPESRNDRKSKTNCALYLQTVSSSYEANWRLNQSALPSFNLSFFSLFTYVLCFFSFPSSFLHFPT